jgi:hypothetical protein
MKDIKKMKAIYYIPNAHDIIEIADETNNKNNFHEKINLFFSIDNCQDNTEYSISIEDIPKKNQINENIESYRTGISENNESNNVEKFHEKKFNKSSSILEFDNFYETEFFFEREQPILFKININNESYSIKSSINSVATARKGIYKKDVNKGKLKEKLIVKSFKNNDYIYINFNVKSSNNLLNFGLIENKIYYKVYGKKLIYSSAVINDDGNFDVSKIPILYFESQIILEFYDYMHELLYTYKSNKEDFLKDKKQIILNLKNKNDIILENTSVKSKHITFLDYLKSDVNVGLQIAIDFTSSNGDPQESDSLHSLVSGTKNDYEVAIESCGNVLKYYDADQLFPVYGFGAILPGEEEVSHCFPINFNNEDPNIYLIENILKVYHDCLNKITLHGPTKFSPIIKTVIDDINNRNNIFEYQILMILTDGIIVDLDETIDQIVIGSFLPLSIIIIGIGDNDFENMDILDGNDEPLISTDGIKRQRDIVKFVRFEDCRNDPEKISEEILDEVPRQIIDFYTMNNIYPSNLIEN